MFTTSKIRLKMRSLNDPDDFEYSGRRSKYPPVWQLLGYFGLGIGSIILAFDRLAEFTKLENTSLRGGLHPMLRVHWLEKFLYNIGGKYTAFGFAIGFGVLCVGFGLWRLWSWLKLRYQSQRYEQS